MSRIVLNLNFLFQITFKLEDGPGVYSVHFAAFDFAANHVTSRRIFMFDNVSKVSKSDKAILYMPTASDITEYRFLTTDTNQLDIQWTGRFSNSRHHVNKWLNGIEPHPDISPEYDDNTGLRTTSAIENLNGINCN